ncbi:MAG: hypothetical protein CMK06_02565 [Ponticaulis sp.]|nr:hypothetical protein [Ponticaulis sp.]
MKNLPKSALPKQRAQLGGFLKQSGCRAAGDGNAQGGWGADGSGSYPSDARQDRYWAGSKTLKGMICGKIVF